MNKPLRHRTLWWAVAGAAVLGLALSGCGGSPPDDTSGTTKATQAGGTDAGGEGPGATGPMASGGGQSMASGGGPMGPMGPGGPMGGGMGGPMGAAAPAAAPSKPPKAVTPPPHRGDPFAPWWDTTPVPPPVLSYTSPIRIAVTESARPEEAPGVDIQEVPSRRVAGILTGSGIYALVDGGPEGPVVVKPGDMLGDTGYRVTSINASSITLRRKVGNQTYTQIVPLTDAGSSLPQGARPGGIGGSAMPGFSGPPPGVGGGAPRGGKGGGMGAD